MIIGVLSVILLIQRFAVIFCQNNQFDYPLLTYGNELDQSIYYFKATDSLGGQNFNISFNFNNLMNVCLHMLPNGFEDYYNPTLESCIGILVNQSRDEIIKYKQNIKLNQSIEELFVSVERNDTYVEIYPKSLDCEYIISQQSVQYVSHHLAFHTVNFIFQIIQKNCKNYNASRFDVASANKRVANSLLGGTTFDIFSMNADSISSCTYIDHRNGSYTVICPLHIHSKKNKKMLGDNCMQLTALVTYEHYDAYSEVLSRDDNSPYYPFRYLLANNQTYCFKSRVLIDKSVSSSTSSRTQNNPLKKEAINYYRQIIYISGIH